VEVLDYFGRAVRHFARLFQVEPEVIAHDLHPGYLSTRWAEEFAQAHGRPTVAVQHHHAHVVSVMAEAGLEGPVIGVSYDGTGYGPDGTVWGGEVLLADRCDFRRAAHLQGVPLPGGEAAVLHPARMALSHLLAAFPPDEASALIADLLPEVERRVVVRQVQRGLNSPLTSSMGRLFDAVGVLLGATREVTYEGQPAMELESMAEEHSGPAPPYPFSLAEGAIDVRPLWRALVADLRAGAPRATIAARFHATVVAFTVAVCQELGGQGAPAEVVLSGGVMQNAHLVVRLLRELDAAGFRPYVHQDVPPNDGGISLGQAVIAAARVTA
jgi:hydrogenase maturation protein HypF